MISRSTSNFKTLQEWSSLGWKVKKGSKAVGKLYGQPVFDHTQVERPPWHNGQRQYEREYHAPRRYEPTPSIANGAGERDYGRDCNCGVGWGCSCGPGGSIFGAGAIRAEQGAQARYESRPYSSRRDLDWDDAYDRDGMYEYEPGADGWGR